MKGATGPFGDYISMGGLFTIIKVRDRLKSYDEDPGWYQHPPGTVALEATEADLARDGINVSGVATGSQSATEPAGPTPMSQSAPSTPARPAAGHRH
jgi:hypothetical protein